jgi:hypothetical protein
MSDEKSNDELRTIINNSAHNYLNIQGLIRKYYGISEDSKSIVGIYLWKTKEDADKFYTPTWVATVHERWGSAPTRLDWETPTVVESENGNIIST